jgi:hypothetical protein
MIQNHEWLTRNSVRTFPIREGSIVVAQSGWSLDPALIVDAKMVADLPGETTFCLHSVTITPLMCSAVIGDAVTGESLGYAVFTQGVDSVMIPTRIHSVIDGFAGFITFGPALFQENYGNLPRGIHQFGSSTLLETRCGISLGTFPVRSVSSGGTAASGKINVVTGNSLITSISKGEDDGDQVDIVQLSLVDPVKFLSPCEGRTSPCECRSMPINSINGVVGDESGLITIELEDENGNVFLLGKSRLQLSMIRSAQSLCSKVRVPDQHGRLPGPSGDYSGDAKPVAIYKNPQDTTFPDPAL